jgi:hypothetical protein
MSITLFSVVQSLCPKASFSVTKEQELIWNDESIRCPTDDEINAERVRMEAELVSTEYKRKRAIDYPAIADQLDMLWHAMDSKEIPKCSEFYNAVKRVKDKYPKS